MSPAKVARGGSRGHIIPIGGAEEKLRDPAILQRFVRLCGGRRAHIVIVPTASRLDDTGERYAEVFRELRADRCSVLPIRDRQDCESKRYLETIDQADGLFLTGGNQLRLSTTVGGTPVAQAIRRGNAQGLHVAGTSAGAAFVPEHMIASGDTGATPRADMVQLAPGLGLTNRFIIDQHFRERDRLGRLLTALAYNPFAVGIGLDEDTAAFIGPDDVLEVVGSGGVTIVDPSELQHSTMDSAHRHDPVSLIGVRMHILVEGGAFDIETRTAELSRKELRCSSH